MGQVRCIGTELTQVRLDESMQFMQSNERQQLICTLGMCRSERFVRYRLAIIIHVGYHSFQFEKSLKLLNLIVQKTELRDAASRFFFIMLPSLFLNASV